MLVKNFGPEAQKIKIVEKQVVKKIFVNKSRGKLFKPTPFFISGIGLLAGGVLTGLSGVGIFSLYYFYIIPKKIYPLYISSTGETATELGIKLQNAWNLTIYLNSSLLGGGLLMIFAAIPMLILNKKVNRIKKIIWKFQTKMYRDTFCFTAEYLY